MEENNFSKMIKTVFISGTFYNYRNRRVFQEVRT